MAHEIVAINPSVPAPQPPPASAPATVPVPAPAASVQSTRSLAPGFRFHPTDEELVRYYLTRKACGKPFRFQAVSEIDVYKSEPWELSDYSILKTRDLEWYFFSPVDRKYCNGSRLNRATGKGYWKATGKDRSVRHKGQTIGMKKTLVFHSGRAPDGKRTNWVMHEYRLVDEELIKAGVTQDAFVLCRIFQKSGLGPPNGDRYAPFVEEEWDEDAALFVPGGEPDDDMPNGDDARFEGNDIETNNLVQQQSEPPITDSPSLQIVCKRERTEECHLNCASEMEVITLFRDKRSKHDDPSSSHANNGSEDSTTTSHVPMPTAGTNFSSALLEFPLLEPVEPRKNQLLVSPPTFDASNLEKSVPPGYLKFISNLETEILNVSMERETLKIEMMRAQAMINVLQSRIDLLSKDNEDLRRHILSKDNEDLRRHINQGVDFKVKLLNISGKRLKLTIWDTAGQERFGILTSSYYRDAHGIVLVYDVTRRESFTNLSEIWAKEVDLYSTNHECIKILVGNKVDKDSEREVSREEGMALALKHKCLFYECSAKTRENVKQCFKDLTLKILERPGLLEKGSIAVKRKILSEKLVGLDKHKGSCCS